MKLLGKLTFCGFLLLSQSLTGTSVSGFTVSNSATPRTVARQAPLSMEFSRQAYWSGLPVPCPGDLHDAGSKPESPKLQAASLLSEPLVS